MTPTQKSAWSDIRRVSKKEGWSSCDNCGMPVARLAGVRTAAGVERWHCTSCMQRYDVSWTPEYPDFGTF